MTVVAVGVFVTTYLLIASEKVNRVAAALGGAGVMLALGIIDSEHAFFSHESGIDWNVIFLLLGTMIIVGTIQQTGLFEYLAIWSAKRARGRPFRIMATFVLITAIASTVLNNVTTVLLIAPVTVLVCERLRLRPVPFLIAEVMASNIGGIATLIGDPPNIIIAGRANLSFNDFLIHLAPLVALLMVGYLGLCRWLFRREFTYRPELLDEIMALKEREAIRDRRLLITSLVVLVLVIGAFVLSSALDIEPSVVALLGAGVLILVTKITAEEAVREVEWPTLVFFMALFVMVGGLIQVGVIEDLSRFVTSVTAGRLFLTTMPAFRS